MTLELEGSMVTTPIEATYSLSKIGSHLVPALVDFHEPPEAVPAYITLRLCLTTSIDVTRPDIPAGPKDRDKDYYQVDKDDENKQLRQSSLVGADIFYFEEPKNIDEVYSLALGEILKVDKGEDPGVYFFEQDGKKEYHKYKNGVLAEVQIDHALYSITFKIKN